jgi:hypothetical protein
MVAELAAEPVASPLDLAALAALVAIALVAAVVAELVTRAPARPGALVVVAEHAAMAKRWSPSTPRWPSGGRRARRGGQAVVAEHAAVAKRWSPSGGRRSRR